MSYNFETHDVYIDPPSGWKYGFPKKVTDSNFRKVLEESSYPKKDIEFALEHLGISWEEKV